MNFNNKNILVSQESIKNIMKIKQTHKNNQKRYGI